MKAKDQFTKAGAALSEFYVKIRKGFLEKFMGENEEEIFSDLLEDDQVIDKVSGVFVEFAKKKSQSSLYSIDCDADPLTPPGWTVDEHIRNGKFIFKDSSIRFYYDGLQKEYSCDSNTIPNKVINGYELRVKLENKPVLNANVLDYLLEHQEIIPEGWKGKRICFWGTVYRSSFTIKGGSDIRYLFYGGKEWHWRWMGLSCAFDKNSPAVLHS